MRVIEESQISWCAEIENTRDIAILATGVKLRALLDL